MAKQGQLPVFRRFWGANGNGCCRYPPVITLHEEKFMYCIHHCLAVGPPTGVWIPAFGLGIRLAGVSACCASHVSLRYNLRRTVSLGLRAQTILSDFALPQLLSRQSALVHASVRLNRAWDAGHALTALSGRSGSSALRCPLCVARPSLFCAGVRSRFVSLNPPPQGCCAWTVPPVFLSISCQTWSSCFSQKQ